MRFRPMAGCSSGRVLRRFRRSRPAGARGHRCRRRVLLGRRSVRADASSGLGSHCGALRADAERGHSGKRAAPIDQAHGGGGGRGGRGRRDEPGPRVRPRHRFVSGPIRRDLRPAWASWSTSVAHGCFPRLVGLQRAKELALTGRMVEADEARRNRHWCSRSSSQTSWSPQCRSWPSASLPAPRWRRLSSSGVSTARSEPAFERDAGARVSDPGVEPRVPRTWRKGSPPFSGDAPRSSADGDQPRLGAILLLALVACSAGTRAPRSRSSPRKDSAHLSAGDPVPEYGTILPRAGLTPRCGRAAGSMRSRYPTLSRSTISSTGWFLSSTIRISPRMMSTALRDLGRGARQPRHHRPAPRSAGAGGRHCLDRDASARRCRY